MKRSDVVALSAVLLCASCVDVQQTVSPLAADLPRGGTAPDGTWRAWTDVREIPDGDPAGILIGPIRTEDDGTAIGRLALRLDILHPAPGDLDIQLAYDADGDGTPEVRLPVELWRSRPEMEADSRYACPVALRGSYFFRDDPGEEDAAFAPCLTQPCGGAFWLSVADTLAEDTGRVLGWALRQDGN